MTRERLVQIADQLAHERETARPVVAGLRPALERAWDTVLPESWRTLGFVEEVTALATAVLEENPGESCSLAQFALSVATSVPQKQYPAVALAQVEGHAWKALGTAHRYLSAHDAALRAYSAGRRRLERFGALAHDEAAIDFATAVVYSEMERYDEALALTKRTAEVFAAFHDEHRIVQTALLKAIIHHRRGDLRAARIAYEDTLAAAQEHDDLHTLAATYNNLGQVLIELNEAGAAASALSRARELFAGLGMSAEVVRTDGSLGRLLLHNGAFDRAISLLGDVRERFLALGMIDEAGVAALSIVDGLVATNQEAPALALIEVVLSEYRAGGLNRHSLIALAYLRDVVSSHPKTRAPIQHVRSYLEQLRREPERAFLPLPE